MKVTYPVVSSEKAGEAFGVEGFPTNVIIGKSGKIAAIKGGEGFEAAVRIELARDLPKLKEAVAALDHEKWSAAHEKLAPLLGDKGADGEAARFIDGWILEQGESRLRAAKALDDNGNWLGALDGLRSLEAWPSDMKCFAEAKEALAALKPVASSDELAKTWREALAAEKAADIPKASSLWEKCAALAKGTKAEEFCKRRVR